MKDLCGIREDRAPIPKDVLEAARLRFKRQIASALIASMADEGTSFEELDHRIGKRPGFSLRYITQLITGKTRDFDLVSDFCLAMNQEPRIEMRRLVPREVGTLADATPKTTPTHHPSATEGGEHG
jgi:hypothetical protein